MPHTVRFPAWDKNPQASAVKVRNDGAVNNGPNAASRLASEAGSGSITSGSIGTIPFRRQFPGTRGPQARESSAPPLARRQPRALPWARPAHAGPRRWQLAAGQPGSPGMQLVLSGDPLSGVGTAPPGCSVRSPTPRFGFADARLTVRLHMIGGAGATGDQEPLRRAGRQCYSGRSSPTR
jgi:hypothetical protein